MEGFTKRQVMELVAKLTLPKNELTEFRRDILNSAQDIEISFDNEQAQKWLEKLVIGANKKLEGISVPQFDVGKMIQMPSDKVFANIAVIFSDKLQDAFQDALSEVVADAGARLNELKAERQSVLNAQKSTKRSGIKTDVERLERQEDTAKYKYKSGKDLIQDGKGRLSDYKYKISKIKMPDTKDTTTLQAFYENNKKEIMEAQEARNAVLAVLRAIPADLDTGVIHDLKVEIEEMSTSIGAIGAMDAFQGLSEFVEAREDEIARLSQRLEELDAEIASLEKLTSTGNIKGRVESIVQSKRRGKDGSGRVAEKAKNEADNARHGYFTNKEQEKINAGDISDFVDDYETNKSKDIVTYSQALLKLVNAYKMLKKEERESSPFKYLYEEASNGVQTAEAALDLFLQRVEEINGAIDIAAAAKKAERRKTTRASDKKALGQSQNAKTVLQDVMNAVKGAEDHKDVSSLYGDIQDREIRRIFNSMSMSAIDAENSGRYTDADYKKYIADLKILQEQLGLTEEQARELWKTVGTFNDKRFDFTLERSLISDEQELREYDESANYMDYADDVLSVCNKFIGALDSAIDAVEQRVSHDTASSEVELAATPEQNKIKFINKQNASLEEQKKLLDDIVLAEQLSAKYDVDNTGFGEQIPVGSADLVDIINQSREALTDFRKEYDYVILTMQDGSKKSISLGDLSKSIDDITADMHNISNIDFSKTPIADMTGPMKRLRNLMDEVLSVHKDMNTLPGAAALFGDDLRDTVSILDNLLKEIGGANVDLLAEDKATYATAIKMLELLRVTKARKDTIYEFDEGYIAQNKDRSNVDVNTTNRNITRELIAQGVFGNDVKLANDFWFALENKSVDVINNVKAKLTQAMVSATDRGLIGGINKALGMLPSVAELEPGDYVASVESANREVAEQTEEKPAEEPTTTESTQESESSLEQAIEEATSAVKAATVDVGNGPNTPPTPDTTPTGNPPSDEPPRKTRKSDAPPESGDELAKEKTLKAIKDAVTAINNKVVKGQAVSGEKASRSSGKKKDEPKTPIALLQEPTSPDKSYALIGVTSQAHFGDIDGDDAFDDEVSDKFIERVKTAYTALVKYKTTLQEAGQLNGDLSDGIDSLANELLGVTDDDGVTILSGVADDDDLAIWKEHFTQFKNASAIIQTLIDDYEELGKVQAKADAETDEIKKSHYQDDAQILRDRIATKAVDVNVEDDRFDRAYQSSYNATKLELDRKREIKETADAARDAVKQQREEEEKQKKVTKELLQLYERLGAAKAMSNSEFASEEDRKVAAKEVRSISGRIGALKRGRAVNKKQQAQFASAKDTAYQQASQDIIAKYDKRTESLLKRYDALGIAMAKADFENDISKQVRTQQDLTALDKEVEALCLSKKQTEELKKQLYYRMNSAKANEKNLAAIQAQQNAEEAKQKAEEKAAERAKSAEQKQKNKDINAVKNDEVKLAKLVAKKTYTSGAEENVELDRQIQELDDSIKLKQKELGIDQQELNLIHQKAFAIESNRLALEESRKQDREAVRAAQKEEKDGIKELMALYEKLGEEIADKQYAETKESKDAHQKSINELVSKIRNNAYYDVNNRNAGLETMRVAQENKSRSLRQREADNQGKQRVRDEKESQKRAERDAARQPLVDAQINTEFSNLSLWYAKLEASGKLTSEVEKKWMSLWDSLNDAHDADSLALWKQDLAQVKNCIEEIIVANKLLGDESADTFENVIALTKLYNKYSINAENAKGTNLKGFYAEEANKVLVERNRILASITLSAQQNAELSNLDADRQRTINEIINKRKDNSEKAAFDGAKKLTGEYVKLGQLQAQYQSTGNLHTKEQLEQQKQKIEQAWKELGLEQQQTEELKKQLNLEGVREQARVNEAALLRRGKQQKANEKAAKDDRAAARLNRTKSVLQRGDDIFAEKTTLGISDDAWNNVSEVKAFNAEMAKLRALYNSLKDADVISPKQKQQLLQQTVNVQEHMRSVKGVIAQYRNLSGEDVMHFGQFNSDSKLSWNKQLEQAVQSQHNGRAIITGYDKATQSLTYTIDEGNRTMTTYTASIRKVGNEMVAVQGETKKTESITQKLMRHIGNEWRNITIGTTIRRLFTEVRQGVQYVREIDLAMTELKKVTNETEESYEKFMNTAAKTADKVGSTMQEIISSTADWSRLGFSMEDAARLAESTSVLLNVSEFQSIDEATNALTSTMQAFGYTADQSMSVVDVMNQIGNNFAVSSDGIATALQDSASALMTANNSYEEAVSLIAAANRVVQNPSEVGGALRTISLRLRGTSVKELEEMGEDTTGAVETKSKLRSQLKGLTGIDILTDTGAYKSTYQILLEISKVWKDLTDENRAGALELIAGEYSCPYVQKCA